MPARIRSGTKADVIARVPLFAGLSKSELGQIASLADEIDLPADKLLIREGERGREFFGEIALVSSLPRIATVKTRKPSRALVIRDVEFRALLQRAPAIAVKVLQAVADRLPRDVV